MRCRGSGGAGRSRAEPHSTSRSPAEQWRCRESNPILLGASEALSQVSFIPKVMRTGGLEPPQPEALALQAGELADAQRPREGVAGRTRTGVAGITTRNVCLYTTATAGTAGLEPAASRLTSERSRRLSYAPVKSRAGGIRTHGLELMRLARTTAPLPRKVGR